MPWECSEVVSGLCIQRVRNPVGMSLVVARDCFRLLSGEPKTFSRIAVSGRDVVCAFCPSCGTRIYHDPSVSKDTVNVKPGTLDDRSWLAPAAHVWTKSKQPWVPIPEGVRCFDGQPG